MKKLRVKLMRSMDDSLSCDGNRLEEGYILEMPFSTIPSLHSPQEADGLF